VSVGQLRSVLESYRVGAVYVIDSLRSMLSPAVILCERAREVARYISHPEGP
jgi:hypothetical protein